MSLGQQKLDFFRWRKPAFIISWLIVLTGVVSVALLSGCYHGD
jgi:preprotein translocase subunit SecF